MNGIVIIDKPEGWTSQDVVSKLRGALRTKRIGHGGTLDPMATGVLPVFVGRATRGVEFFEHAEKTYEAVLRLGLTTDTEDISGTVLEEREVHISEEDFLSILPSFRGQIQQIPPMYSALKVNGQKLYDLARKGKEVERQPREIEIFQLECLEFHGNEARLRVRCSKGTYIRTLCKDIGNALGCGGCMAALRRVQAGEYTISEAIPLQTLLEAEDKESFLRPVDSMFRNHPAVTLTEKQALRCRNGNSFSVSLPEGTYRAYAQNGEFLMLAKVEDGVMSTIKSFWEVGTAPSSERTVAPTLSSQKIFALGFFDGVHRGHQALLTECCRMAAQFRCETAAITFDRHPQALFAPKTPALINTNADRDALLRNYGIRHISRLPVTKEVMSTNWQVFLTNLLSEGAAGFVCGDDFRFGHKGEGDSEALQAFCRERNLPCVIVPEQTLEGVRISSTHIRQLIETGKMETAASFLGHPHMLTGKVIPGRQLGRTIGIPTANLQIPEGIVTPALGVYACRVHIGKEAFLAVTNVGKRPTVAGEGITVEPWILDFEGDLYGREITLEFHHFLRPERKFDTLAELKAEIEKNAAQTRDLLQ